MQQSKFERNQPLPFACHLFFGKSPCRIRETHLPLKTPAWMHLLAFLLIGLNKQLTPENFAALPVMHSRLKLNKSGSTVEPMSLLKIIDGNGRNSITVNVAQHGGLGAPTVHLLN